MVADLQQGLNLGQMVMDVDIPVHEADHIEHRKQLIHTPLVEGLPDWYVLDAGVLEALETETWYHCLPESIGATYRT